MNVPLEVERYLHGGWLAGPEGDAPGDWVPALEHRLWSVEVDVQLHTHEAKLPHRAPAGLGESPV